MGLREFSSEAYVILLLFSTNEPQRRTTVSSWFLFNLTVNSTYVHSHQRRTCWPTGTDCANWRPHIWCRLHLLMCEFSGLVQCWKPFKPIVSIIIWPWNIAWAWTGMYILRPDLRCSEIIQTSILSCHLLISLRSVSRDYPFDVILYMTERSKIYKRSR